MIGESFPTEPIRKAFDQANIYPPTPEEPEEEIEKKTQKSVTPVDFFGIPAEKTENLEVFLKWFKPRFGPLETQEDLERVSQIIWEATEVIQAKPYLLAPREGGGLGVSRKIRKDMGMKEGMTAEEEKMASKRVFKNQHEILSFFRKTAVDIESPKEKERRLILSPDRKSEKGAERLSVCRILSVAYALEIIRHNLDFKNFFENARLAMGRSEETREASILPLSVNKELEILRDPELDEFKILNWLGNGQVIEKAHLVIDGKSYFFPEIHIGIKGGLRAFLKVLRDPAEESLGAMDDFFRIRLVLKDEADTIRDILPMLEGLEREAEKKTDPRVLVDFKAKNYFTPQELEENFPEILPNPNENSDSVFQRGILNKVEFDKNPSSGEKYRNISMKIKFYPKSNLPKEELEKTKPFFSFEVQIMRQSELADNEREVSSSSHFAVVMRQAALTVSRLNGKLKRNEFIKILKEYLDKEVDTESMPPKLQSGEIIDLDIPEKDHEDKIRLATKKGFEIDFSGSVERKAEKIFDFLVQEGVIRQTVLNFPQIKAPTEKEKKISDFFVHKVQLKKFLNLIDAEQTTKKII